jgi:hypothetical protein
VGRMGYRNEQKAARRAERDRQNKLKQQADRRWRIGITSFFSVLVLLLAGLFVVTKPPERGVGPEGTKKYAYTVRDHTLGEVSYKENPPVGGAHRPAWQACGFYAEPVDPALAVHSLEHGAVWITYRPDLTAKEIAGLRGRVGDDSHLLMSPNPGQLEPVVATAWNHQLRVDDVDDKRIRQFVTSFIRGPQTPEPGASCGPVTAPMGAPVAPADTPATPSAP